MAENFYQKRTRKIIVGIILCPLIFIAAALPLKVFAQAYDISGIVYVNQSAPTNGDGSSWASPLQELRDAVTIANSDPNVHQIWVAKGSYTPTNNANRSVSFDLPGGLSLYGGFNGTESNLTDRNVTLNPTILSGDIGETGVSSDNSYNVVEIVNNTDAVTVDGFTITGANNNSPEPINGGGLVINENTATITLNQLTVTGNTAFISGGVDIEFSSSVSVNQTVISNNTATTGDAGGMGVYNSVVMLTNTVFDGNISQNGKGNFAEGGALEVDGMLNGGTTVTCNNCVFNNNRAVNSQFVHGGAIMNFGGTLNLTNCTLYNNTVTSGASFSGSNGVTDEGNDDATTLNFINTIIWSTQQLNLAVNESNYPASISLVNCDIAGAVFSGANMISTDPLFTNPTSPVGADGIWGTADDGLMLSCLSPAHYSGTSLGATNTDIEGNFRSNPPDMGAYQQNGNPVQPSVSIDFSAGQNCPGVPISFIATPTSGGTNPSYQWQVNGVNTGNNAANIDFASLNPGDVVSVILTTDYTVCVSTMTANSNSITINSLPQVIPSSITTVNAGSAYFEQQITATGGATPYTFAVTNGSLPPGITLGTDDGTLTGASNVPGSYQFTVQVTENACGNIASQTFSADINGLTALTTTGGVITSFDPTITSYNLSVPNATSAISFTPTAGNSNVMININGTAVLSGSPSSFISLTVGDNIINVNETAQDLVTVNTYTVTVTRAPSSVATLDNLVVSTGTLSPALFTSGNMTYSDDVKSGTTSINLTPFVTDPTASVTVNGNLVSSGSPSDDIPLSLGANPIPVVVTAQDGTTTDTYTVTVNVPPSNNANLANLTVNNTGLTTKFDPATNNYEDDVDNSITSVEVTPTNADLTATVTVNGVAVQSGFASNDIALNVGSNIITTIVTAQDGITTDTYTINVVRAPSSNAGLNNLIASNGPLSPPFDPGTTDYDDDVDVSITSITVTPTVADPTATVTVNGVNVTSGSPSQQIALNVGSNTITVMVTAQDGTTTNVYTINADRKPSSNATLANLTVNNTGISTPFDPATNNYEDDVDNSITSVNVTPTAADATATITVNGVAVQSGFASGNIALNVGSNIITTIVTAQDGITTDTYTINAVRLPSSNASLTNLTVSTGALSPSFDAGITDYEQEVDNTVTSTTVTPTVSDATATITVNGTAVQSGNASGSIALNVGPNIITTVITAQDGTTTTTYNIVINRDPSSITSLASLSISSGVLSPSFDTGIINYTDTVSTTTTTVTITPTVSDPNATITVNNAAVTSGTASPDISLSVGTNVITTIVTAQDGNSTQTYTITVIRNKAAQTLTFNPLADIQYGSPDFDPGASASSGLPIIYSSSDPTVATIVNSKIHIISTGNTIITAAVADDPNYGPASPVSQPLTVTKADQTISSIAFPVLLPGSEVDLSGIKASSGLPVTFSISDETIATIKSDSLLALQVGTTTLTASQAGNNLYNPVSSDFTISTVVIDADDQLVVHPAVTPNGDGVNDFFLIEGIKSYPENTVVIANRNGVKVYYAYGYDNEAQRFDGHSNITNDFQPAGTYFYLIDYTSNGRHKRKTGFIVLKY